MDLYCCPVCGAPLRREGGSLKCRERHCFDIAKQGYVNLLTAAGKHARVPGDNKLMVSARRAFLEKGYYALMREELCGRVCALLADCPAPAVLDVGCGEGYYTERLAAALRERGHSPAVCGIDISKTALAAAAKKSCGVAYAVASAFHLPVPDAAFDLVTNLFAPYCGGEFLRVLKPGGLFVMVIPGARHLYELKCAVYDAPYENEVKDFALEGFDFLEQREVAGEILLTSGEDIRNLFCMTPYCYKTSAENAARLDALDRLQTTIQFELLFYRKRT